MMFHLVRKDQEIFNITEAEEYVKHDVQYLKKEAILRGFRRSCYACVRMHEGEFYKREVAQSFVEVSRSYLTRLLSYKL